MCSKAFLQKLAIERCQYNLAQLTAVTVLTETPDERSEQTVRALIDFVSRDLLLIEDHLDGEAF